MPWVVKTVQEVVDDVPLALDTSNIDAIEAALKVDQTGCQRYVAYHQLHHGAS
jgi:cobalamin-dependent methionine synthase I